MFSRLALLLPIWILTLTTLITCLLRCLLVYKISRRAGGLLGGRNTITLSTLSKFCLLGAFILAVTASILVSISASKYLQVLRIVESKNFPNDFQSLLDYILRYQPFITVCVFGCLWLVKGSIVYDCKGFTEEENLVRVWIGYTVFLLISFIVCPFLQPVSDMVCLPDCTGYLYVDKSNLWGTTAIDIVTDCFVSALPVALILRRPSFTPHHKAEERRVYTVAILVRITILVAVVRGALASIDSNVTVLRIVWYNFFGVIQSLVSLISAAAFTLRRIWVQGKHIKQTQSAIRTQTPSQAQRPVQSQQSVFE